MNCTDVQNHIDDYLDGALDGVGRQAFLAHVHQCEDCRRQLDQAQEVQRALLRIPVEAMSEGFAQRAMQRAISENQERKAHKHRHWFAAGFGGTLAAGIVLALVAAGPMNVALTGKTPVNQISMNVSEPHQLDVVFSVPESMNNVEMELQLSKGLHLTNYPGQRVLRWKTSLKQGKNRLPLSVKASRPGEAEVIARIIKNGKQKEFHIHLNVKGGSLSSVTHVKNWI